MKNEIKPLTLGEEQRMFAIEHSMAIIVFAELEEQLCNFVAFQARKSSSPGMKTAMYGIESFRAKLEFADRFTRAYVEGKPGMSERWENVAKALQTANKWRNQLVHQSKRVFPRSDPGRRVVLLSPITNAPTTGPSPEAAIGVRKLVEARLLASEARNRLGGIWGLLQNGRDVYDGHPPLRPPRLADMISEYRRSTLASLVVNEP